MKLTKGIIGLLWRVKECGRVCKRPPVIIMVIFTIVLYVMFNEEMNFILFHQVEGISNTVQIQLKPEHLAALRLHLQIAPSQQSQPSLKLQPKKVVGLDIYVYTAVAVAITGGNTDIRIQAFRNVDETKTLKCCFFKKDGTYVSVDATIKYSYGSYDYISTAFYFIVNSTDVPKTISLSDNCLNMGTVLEVSRPEKPKGSISVCFHAIYGFPDPQLMTEWFEFIKLQGVERVFISPVSHENFVDERSMRVFEYYKKQGLVKLIPYELVQYSTDNNRFVERGDKMYSDEILPVYDCMVRSSLYKYTAYIDFDEVIMFHSNPLDLLGNLDKLFDRHPYGGIFLFKMESFVLNWTATHNSDLIMMKYTNRTEALVDRGKMVYIQGRYRAVEPHTAYPAGGYQSVDVPESIGAVHHYRSCRVGWTDDYCLQTPRYRDDAMLQFESFLKEKVKRVPEHIRNGVKG